MPTDPTASPAPSDAERELVSHVDVPVTHKPSCVSPARVKALEDAPRIEFHQHDWIPGFAAFAPDATTPSPDARAFCVLNLGAILAAVETGDLPRADVPYIVAESMMHELMHALEQWAGCEFSEERIEALLDRYRAAILSQETLDDR